MIVRSPPNSFNPLLGLILPKKSPVTIPLVWTVRQDLQLLATLLEDSARHGEEVCESPAEAAARILKLCGLEVGSVAFVGMMSHDLQS